MKFIRKKLIKGHEYYYFQYPFTDQKKKRIFTKFLGKELPPNLEKLLAYYFDEIAKKTNSSIEPSFKNFFLPKNTLPIEQARFWYQSLHHELFENDFRLFRSLFGILFILNSNRSEGSQVTRRDIEKIVERKQKPKTIIDLEVINSLAALRFAFSKEMKWNLASFKKLHLLLFEHISPQIAGKFKKENNVINNESTTDFKSVTKELKNLLEWFKKHKKSGYPPRIALEFHYRFEAIHPFTDGNGRIGRLLFNTYLIQEGYMPVIFFSENHSSYMNAISQARQGRTRKLANYFIEQLIKTKIFVLKYKQEGVIRGGSPQVGRWEIERGKIRKF